MESVLFEIKNVSKAFGPVQALANVSLTVRRGEVHALVGENGAGKSTLMKILSGVYRPDSGELLSEGQPYRVTSPVDARSQGVAMVYQELNLAPHLTVAENLTLGIEESTLGFIRPQQARMQRALEWLGHGELDVNATVGELNIGTQQVVEIARALVSDARVVIMDEPTSSLSTADSEALFKVVERLAEAGVAVIYISHFLDEVKRICRRYTVLRDGESVDTGALEDVSLGDLVEKMVGRALTDMFPRIEHDMGEPVLDAQSITAKKIPRDVSFRLHRGEILGIAGLVGSGRSETIRSLFGLHPVQDGTVNVHGSGNLRVKRLTPGKALASGLDLLCENRKDEGLAVSLPICTNVALSTFPALSRFGFVRRKREQLVAERWRERLGIRCRDVDQEASALSGGNQQKVALARILHHDSDILFLDEPTRGIDVGSKAEICRCIGELAKSGKAIVMVSSYLPELLGVCDSLAVMHRGALSPVRPIGEWSETSIMTYATSGRLIPVRDQDELQS